MLTLKNKRAGFEMSVTTLVVIVLAVVMLILGLYFVRTIVCGAIDVVGNSFDLAKKQLEEVYISGAEVTCAGVQKPLTMVPGENHVVMCKFMQDIVATETYDYKFKIDSTNIPGVSKSTIEGWVLGGVSGLQGKLTAQANQEAYASFSITIPKNIPQGSIIITLDATKLDRSPISSQKMYFNVKSLGAFRQTVC